MKFKVDLFVLTIAAFLLGAAVVHAAWLQTGLWGAVVLIQTVDLLWQARAIKPEEPAP